MSALLIATGTLLVLVAVTDTVLTTMSAGNGAGPLTGRVGRGVWRLLLALSARGPCRVLRYGGPLVLLHGRSRWVSATDPRRGGREPTWVPARSTRPTWRAPRRADRPAMQIVITRRTTEGPA